MKHNFFRKEKNGKWSGIIIFRNYRNYYRKYFF